MVFDPERRSRLKSRLLFIGICLVLMGPPISAQAELHFSNDFSFTVNEITGSGKEQSSLTDGFSYLNLMGANGTGVVKGFDYHFNIGTRLTDDRRIDDQTFIFTNLQARLTDNKHFFNFGDTFQSFSQYALSTSVKGGSYRFSQEDDAFPEITLIYGYANPRWDNFRGFGEDRVDALIREVTGGKLSHAFFDSMKAGFSVVRTDDKDRVNPEDELNEIMAYTVDWEYDPIPGLTFLWESSFSDAVVSWSDEEDSTEFEGDAHKIMAIGDGGPSRVTLEYEKVSPDFRTVVGAATPDREKAKARWRYKATRRHTVTTGFLWYRDDLDDLKDYRTDHYKPTISLSTRRIFNRQYASTDLSYRMNITRIDNDTTSRTDQVVNLNYRDRFGIVDSDSNLGFSLYDVKQTPDDKSFEYIYNTTINSRHHAGLFVFKPSVNLGGWTFRRELEETTDQIYEYAVGLGVDVPEKKITSNLKAGHNRLIKDEGDDSAKLFARLSVFYRPDWFIAGNRSMLFLRALVNDFDYDADERSFRETGFTMGMNIQL